MRTPFRCLVALAAAWVAGVLLAASGAASFARAEDLGSPEFLRFRERFLSVRLDSLHAYRAQNLLLTRSAASFLLEDGEVAFTPEIGVGGRAAVFMGRGTFAFTPANPVEREQLRRFYGVRSLRVNVRAVTFFFTDSTERELKDALQPSEAAMSPKAGAMLKEGRRFLLRTDRQSLDPSAGLALLEAPALGWFWAHVVDEGGKSYFVALDPWAAERVQLQRPPDNEQFGLVRLYARENICQFAADGDSLPEGDNRPNLVVDDVKMRLAFDDAMRVRTVVTYTLRGVAPQSRWFVTAMHAKLAVDSVQVNSEPAWAPENPRRYFRERIVNLWWFDLGRPLAAGETRTLRIVYHGEIFDRRRELTLSKADDDTISKVTQEWLVFQHQQLWYPYPLFANRSTWDLAFRVPREYPLVASGEMESRREDGRFVESRWLTRDRSYLASFVVDFMRGFEVTGATLSPLRVWFHSAARSGKVETYTAAQLADLHSYEAGVTRDVARAVQFYTSAFGPPRIRQLNVVESPNLTYLAYPNLVHMMRKEDQFTPGAAFSTDFVRAHELAHQWWGYGVTPRTYHDKWLAEAFADFSAMWYVQAGRRDVNSYMQILRSLREYLLENRRFVFGPGQEAGPIWLGRRNESSTTEGDYSLVIYKKGAWVLHMLRNVLLDVDTGDDSKFRTAMQEFYLAHSGGYASTEDFRAAVERAAGEDLGWFFEQWVYGTDAPRYKVEWSAAQLPSKQWQVKLHVDQSGTSEAFRMPVLVRLDFGDEKFARTRVMVQGPVTDVLLPATAEAPTKLVFNDLESVLCEVESVKRK